MALIQDNGTISFKGNNSFKKCELDTIDIVHIRQVECGEDHTVILGDDGRVGAIGSNCNNQCNLKMLRPGLRASEIACGKLHTAILLEDGSVFLTGSNNFNQCDVHALTLNRSQYPIEHI